MNWKCKLGFHDWQQLVCKTHSEIKNEELKKENKNHIGFEVVPDMVFESKICLRCGKHIDEITSHRLEVQKAIALNKVRVTKAKELLCNTSEDIIRFNINLWDKHCKRCGSTSLREDFTNMYICLNCGQRHESF